MSSNPFDQFDKDEQNNSGIDDAFDEQGNLKPPEEMSEELRQSVFIAGAGIFMNSLGAFYNPGNETIN